MVVVFSLQIGDREAKRSGDALRRGQSVGDSLTESVNWRCSRTRSRGGGHSLTLLLVEGNALSEELGLMVAEVRG